MPSPYVKSLSKETGKSIDEIEKLWKEAKKITSDTFDKEEKEFKSKEYAYTTGIVKNMLGIKEEVLDPLKFLESDLSASEYLETLTSGSFPSLMKNDINDVDDVVEVKETDDDEEFKETDDDDDDEEDNIKEKLKELENVQENYDWNLVLDSMEEFENEEN